MRANITYCFPYLCRNVYLCCCFSPSYGPSCPPGGCVIILRAIPRTRSHAFSAAVTTPPLLWWSRLLHSDHIWNKTAAAFPASVCLPHFMEPLWSYLTMVIITNVAALPELILFLPPLRGTPHHHWQHKLKLWLYQTEASQEVRLGENHQRNPPRLAKPLVRMTDWLAEAEWSFLP